MRSEKKKQKKKTVPGFRAVVILSMLALPGLVQDARAAASRYKALKCPTPSSDSTWAILDRNGANAQVTPYLSSLAQGESGTGVISSPPFIIGVDEITFTICGHDGPSGGQGKNYIALVDARKGKVLLKTPPPQHDAMQEQSWDVSGIRGVEVRIEVHDGDSGGGFAWMGIGRIDAGDALRVDYSKGMPEGWEQPEKERDRHFETITGGVPFVRDATVFTLIPKEGSVEIPCGFAADRLFFLGCTVNPFRPLETYGGIEVHYRNGSPEVFPLMCGFTLDGRCKRLSPSPAMHLHASGDPYQHYLVVEPRSDVIEKIRLVAEPERFPVPRITAITCETDAESERLVDLPNIRLTSEASAWIESHGISTDAPDLGEVMEAIRRSHKMPPADADTSVRFRKHTIDEVFRSEGVAVADFNGDGQRDIAAGSVYYAGPDWKMVAMLEEPEAFNRLGYSDAFLCFADDLNRDQATDLIVVGFPGRQTHWLENPGKAGARWNKHLAIERTGNETPMYADVGGDGESELVFMNEGKAAFARPGDDPTAMWTVQVIANPGDPGPGHGLGVGDINRDGRTDVVVPGGWWEGPLQQDGSPWRFHAADIFGGAQVCIADFDGDGDNDLLGSSPHAYGIAWSEQTPEGWATHEIDNTLAQTHAIHLADINGDGLVDFVTGKRFWAHNGHDSGSFQPAALYWYELQRNAGRPEWTKHLIDVNSGVGLHFEIVDVNEDGLLDIVTSNKLGVHYFEQIPPANTQG